MPKRKASSARPAPDSKHVCIIHYAAAKTTDFAHFSDLPNPQVRFNSICEVRDKRQSQPLGSAQRCDVICGQIPNQLGENQDYHHECYQRFTSKLDRLKSPSTAATDERQSLKHGHHSSQIRYYLNRTASFVKAVGERNS